MQKFDRKKKSTTHKNSFLSKILLYKIIKISIIIKFTIYFICITNSLTYINSLKKILLHDNPYYSRIKVSKVIKLVPILDKMKQKLPLNL